MTEGQIFKFERHGGGELEVTVEGDGSLFIEWQRGHGYMGERCAHSLSADETRQILAALGKAAEPS